MKKEQFVNFMNNFNYQREKNDKWIDLVEEALGGAWEQIMKHNYEALMIDTISEVLNDKDEWLKYFLYERDGEWFTFFLGTKEEFTVDSYEKLYDLIKGVF